ncbi:hypothetical protein GOV05_02990 [Candidatus Woesearchaeota archaeon]|nr:hypothetical protein [Candidatus Woesearchaeota archaeon]
MEFTEMIKAISSKKAGGPFSSGYTPSHYKGAFPYLQNSDFGGVKANQGTYLSSGGGLTHYFEGDAIITGGKPQEIHPSGYDQLRANLESRLGISDDLEIIKAIAGD